MVKLMAKPLAAGQLKVLGMKSLLYGAFTPCFVSMLDIPLPMLDMLSG
jgi:hypothetical protein